MIVSVATAGFLLLAAYAQRLVFSAFEANDQRWILWLLRRQAGRRWVHYAVEDNLVPADLGYPVLFHWLLARLPRGAWVPAGFLLNAAFDLLSAVGVALLVALLWTNGGDGHGWAAIAAGAAFLFCPALLPPTARMMAFNGRAFGLLLFNLYALVLGAHLVTGHWFFIALAVVLLVAITLSSQFAFQAAVALTVVVTAWYQAWFAGAVTLVAFGALAAIRVVGLREPLRYFAGLYRWAFANRHRNTAPAVRSRWYVMARTHWRARQWRALWLSLFMHSAPVIIALYGVWVWVVLALALETPSSSWRDPVMEYATVASFAMLATAVLTSFQPFSIFGQAERYLENGAAPTAVVLGGLLVASHDGATFAAVALALGAAFAVIGLNMLTILVQHGRLLSGNPLDFAVPEGPYVEWLEGRPGPLRILTVPMARGQTLIEAFHAHGRHDVSTLYDWLSPKAEPALDYMSRYLVGQSYSPERVAAACKDLGADLIVVFKREAHLWTGERHEQGTDVVVRALRGCHSLVGENDDYAVFEILPPGTDDEAMAR